MAKFVFYQTDINLNYVLAVTDEQHTVMQLLAADSTLHDGYGNTNPILSYDSLALAQAVHNDDLLDFSLIAPRTVSMSVSPFGALPIPVLFPDDVADLVNDDDTDHDTGTVPASIFGVAYSGERYF